MAKGFTLGNGVERSEGKTIITPPHDWEIQGFESCEQEFQIEKSVQIAVNPSPAKSPEEGECEGAAWEKGELVLPTEKDVS